MLSTITAAEAQFRYETATRDRELALMASIRERRRADEALVTATVAPVRTAGASVGALGEVIPASVSRPGWPRPISVRGSASAACVAV
jgi:hypothetical protein